MNLTLVSGIADQMFRVWSDWFLSWDLLFLSKEMNRSKTKQNTMLFDVSCFTMFALHWFFYPTETDNDLRKKNQLLNIHTLDLQS